MPISFSPRELAAIESYDCPAGSLVILPNDSRYAIACVPSGQNATQRYFLRVEDGVPTTSEISRPYLARQLVARTEINPRLVLGDRPTTAATEYAQLLGFVGVDTSGPFFVVRKSDMGHVAIVDIRTWTRELGLNRLDFCEHWFKTWQLLEVDPLGNESAILQMGQWQ